MIFRLGIGHSLEQYQCTTSRVLLGLALTSNWLRQSLLNKPFPEQLDAVHSKYALDNFWLDLSNC
jgi:hypothetical protein